MKYVKNRTEIFLVSIIVHYFGCSIAVVKVKRYLDFDFMKSLIT